MPRDTVEEKLVAKQIHFGILGLCPRSKELECDPLFTDQMVLIVAANHPWASRGTVPSSELTTVDWVCARAGLPRAS